MNYKNKLIVANSSITDPIFAGKLILIVHDDEDGSKGVIINAKCVGQIAFGEFKVNEDEELPTPDMILNKLSKKPQKFAYLYFGGPVQHKGVYFMHAYEEFANFTFDDLSEEKSEFDLGIPTSFNTSSYDDDIPSFWEANSKNNEYSDSEIHSENHPFGNAVNGLNQTVMDGLYFGAPAAFCGILKESLEDSSKNKFKFFSGHSAWSQGQLQNEIDGGAWTVIEDVDASDIFFDEDAVNELIKIHSKKYTNVNWLPTFEGFDPKRN